MNEQSNDEYSLAAIYDTLGYDLPDRHLTTEDVHVVHPIEKPSALFAISTQRSFVVDGKTVLPSYSFKNLTSQDPDIQGNGSTEHQSTISNVAQPLLLLICAAGALPRTMIDRAGLHQTRWNEDGVQYHIDPQEASFDERLKDLFSDPSQLRLVLDHLLLSAAIRVERSDDVEIIYASTSASSHSHGSSTFWMEQVLRLFCHIFPREPMDL